MSKAAPLRFLGLVLGGWVGVRAALLAPAWWPAATELEPPPAGPVQPARTAAAAPPVFMPLEQQSHERRPLLVRRPSTSLRTSEEVRFPVQASAARAALPDGWAPRPPAATSAVGAASAPLSPPAAASPPVFPSRWSVSAWALVRRGEQRSLAAGGTLAGSQAGARITYRLRDRLLLSGRIYAPLNAPEGAEAALGIEWQPVAAVPVRLLGERRQAIGGDGRSAFALLAHGGVGEQRVVGPIVLDAYAQAGMVGVKSRDAFVDGLVRLSLPVAQDLHVGLGAWGAAQPGVSRIDVGPQASYQLPGLGARLRVSAEWRVRVAGDARPGSGPALTLSTDF